MVCFKFLHPKFSNNTNKHKLKSNLQKLEFSKHLVQIAWVLTITFMTSFLAVYLTYVAPIKHALAIWLSRTYRVSHLSIDTKYLSSNNYTSMSSMFYNF